MDTTNGKGCGVDRRTVIGGGLGMVATLAFMGAGCGNGEPESTAKEPAGVTFDVSSNPGLASVGGAAYETFGDHNDGRPVILIRATETSFTVLSSVCTHQGCQVMLPDSPGGVLACPCHDTHFSSADGSRLSGPAEEPLKVFKSTYDQAGNTLTIMF